LIVNKNLIIRHIQKILVYSARKIKENFNPPYSTLKPDTNSDSPSAKSKGARFVSTTQLINNKKKSIGKKKNK
jgi:hypothetical protein